MKTRLAAQIPRFIFIVILILNITISTIVTAITPILPDNAQLLNVTRIFHRHYDVPRSRGDDACVWSHNLYMDFLGVDNLGSYYLEFYHQGQFYQTDKTRIYRSDNNELLISRQIVGLGGARITSLSEDYPPNPHRVFGLTYTVRTSIHDPVADDYIFNDQHPPNKLLFYTKQTGPTNSVGSFSGPRCVAIRADNDSWDQYYAANYTFRAYFVPEVVIPKTMVNFNIIPSENIPGSFSFNSISSDNIGRPISHSWEFGDNSAIASGDDVSHQYIKTGTFNVTLKGRVLGETPITITKPVMIKATNLTTKFHFTDNRSNGHLPLDEEVEVTLDVKTDNGIGGVKDIVVLPKFIRAPNLEIINKPDIPTKFNLLPNQTQSFKWTLKSKSGGRWRITARIEGKDIDDNTAEAFDDFEGSVTGDELKATITLTPDRIEAQEEDIGSDPIPVEFKADLKVCNTTDQPIDDVKITRFRAHPAIPQTRFLVTKLTGPNIDTITGLLIGTLAANSCVSYTSEYRADDDNEIEVDTIVSGVTTEGTRLTSIDSKVLSIGPKYLLEVKTKILRPFDTEPLLPAGNLIRIGGSIKNLSNTHRIQVGNMYPELKGNAGAQSLSWDTVGTDPVSAIVPEHPQFLEPGEEKDFLVQVTTLASDPRYGVKNKQNNGGTRAFLTFTPWGIATAPDGSLTVVKPDRIKSDDGNLELKISIDDSISIPATNPVAIAGGVMRGSADALWEMTAGVVYSIPDLVQLPATVLYGASTYQSRVWNSFTEDEKSTFAKETSFLIISVLLRNVELAQEDLGSLETKVNQSVLASMTEMSNEWELGDQAAVTRVYVKYGAQIIGGVALPVAMTKLAKSPKAIIALERVQLALNNKMRPLLSQVDDVVTLRRLESILLTVENGTEASLEVMAKVMGYSIEEVAEIRRISKKFNILITSRSRYVESIKWIKQFGAKVKLEAFKVKTTSPLDEILGYPKIYGGESSVGAMIFKKPDALIRFEKEGGRFVDHIDTFLSSKGINKGSPLFHDARHRIIDRAKEWEKWGNTYKKWGDRGWVDSTFNNKFNGISDDVLLAANPKIIKQGAGTFEGFRMRPLHAKDSPFETYVMELFDANTGKWKPITGDIDIAAFTRTDSTALDELLHIEVIEEFNKGGVISLPHGESATGGALEFLAKQFKPGEAGIQIGPTDAAPRFVRLDLETGKSYSNGPRDYHLEWKGGFSNVTETSGPSSIRPQLESPNITGPIPAKIDKPQAVSSSTGGGSTVGGCKMQSSSSPNAKPYIMNNGKLSVVDSLGNTTPSTLHDTCFAESSSSVSVIVSPSTRLSSSVLRNSSILEVYSDITVPPFGVRGGFLVGQVIAIGAGSDHPEIRTISEFGSILLDEPLEFDHEEGEVVIVLSALTVDNDNDGIPDASDAFPNNPNESVDTDNDGIGNNADPDDDDDGFSDIAELAANTDPLDSNSKPAGQPESEPIPSLSQWTLLLLVLFLFMLGSIAARKNHRI